MTLKKDYFKKGLGAILALALTVGVGCSGGGSSATEDADGASDDTEVSALTRGYPSGLALTSPLELSQSNSENSLVKAATTGSMVSASYSLDVSEIEAILNGTSLSDCAFEAAEILTSLDQDATCYGPTVAFNDHPEWTIGNPMYPSNTGELPRGDLGIWSETEGETSEACAAAQLNARMEGVAAKTEVAMKAMASMVCVANVNSLSLPSSGSSLDLASYMNDMSTHNALGLTFSTATLTLDTVDGNDAYEYVLEFTFNDGVIDHEVDLAMTHVPLDSSNETYRGRFSYAVNNSFDAGNCPAVDSDGDGQNDVTDAGSVLYDLSDSSTLKLRADAGQYCGYDAAAVQADGLVDPSDKYDATSNTDGWGNNFTTVIAQFDPSDNTGSYSMAWQAGLNDGNTRSFNVALSSEDEGLEGDAFYGYADDIASWDGRVSGFICNWAGPGADHTLVDYVQHQVLAANSDEAVFEATSSTIGYAPTTTCDYDATGSFEYDIDGDGDIDTDDTTLVSAGVTNELLAVTDADLDGNLDEIAAQGFTVPEEPSNF